MDWNKITCWVSFSPHQCCEAAVLWSAWHFQKHKESAHGRDRSCWLTLGCQVGIRRSIRDAACPRATHPLGQWRRRASRLRRCAMVKKYDPALARCRRKPLRVHTVTGLLEPPLGVMRQRGAGTLSVMPAHSSSVTRCINIQEVHTHTWYINMTWCSVKYIYVCILAELALYDGADFTTELHLQSQIPLVYKNCVLSIEKKYSNNFCNITHKWQGGWLTANS